MRNIPQPVPHTADHSQCPQHGDQTEVHRRLLRQAQARRRQRFTILFAAAVLLAGTLASAAASEPATDGPEPQLSYRLDDQGHTPHPAAVLNPQRLGGGTVPQPARAEGRPVYAELEACLANFDADADPDGWRARIVVRDRDDRPVRMRARATFELMPRLPMLNHNQWIDGQRGPVRWSVPLEFDPQGVATVKLPLRKSLRPLLGWAEAEFPSSGMRSHNAGWNRRDGRRRSFVTTDLRKAIGTPNLGQLRVRVSIPGEGVFDAVVPVQIRPPVLVDTSWPYR